MAALTLSSRVITPRGRHGTITHTYRSQMNVPMAYVRFDGADKAVPFGIAELRPEPVQPDPIGAGDDSGDFADGVDFAIEPARETLPDEPEEVRADRHAFRGNDLGVCEVCGLLSYDGPHEAGCARCDGTGTMREPFGIFRRCTECTAAADDRCDYAGCLGPADGTECRHPGPDEEEDGARAAAAEEAELRADEEPEPFTPCAGCGPRHPLGDCAAEPALSPAGFTPEEEAAIQRAEAELLRQAEVALRLRETYDEFQAAWREAREELRRVDYGSHEVLDRYTTEDLSWIGGRKLPEWIDYLEDALRTGDES